MELLTAFLSSCSEYRFLGGIRNAFVAPNVLSNGGYPLQQEGYRKSENSAALATGKTFCLIV
jgi:hypothetical protein